ncbi:hypothetical protein ACFQL3_08700 [Natronoarchaeum sp. GCM10025321]|uniref:hypothetical protein n=2 Tax=unclassified Natronoarchaeum TaxID=2620183 RepID=UPI003609826E
MASGRTDSADSNAGSDREGSGARGIGRDHQSPVDRKRQNRFVESGRSSIGRWIATRFQDSVIKTVGSLVAFSRLAPTVDPHRDGDSGPVRDWERSFDDDNIAICDIAADTEGGYILAGGIGDSPDFWIAKTDQNGSLEWSSRMHHEGVCVVRSIQPVEDGHVFAGTSSTTDGDDIVLTRTGQRGTVQWERTFGGDAFDCCQKVVQSNDGGYVIGGSTQSYATAGQDMWLLKTTGDGRVEWERTYDRSYTDMLEDIVRTRDDGYALVGTTLDEDTDCWIVMTDSDGTVDWEESMSRNGGVVGRSVIQKDDGGIVIAGVSNNTGGQQKEGWLASLDAEGGMEWQRTYDDPNDMLAVDIIQTSDDGLLSAGTVRSSKQKNILLVKTDSEGNREWAKKVAGRSSIPPSLLNPSPGTYVVGGSWESGRAKRETAGWLAQYSPSTKGPAIGRELD